MNLSIRTCALTWLTLAAAVASADPVPAVLPEGYSVQTITLPKGVPFSVTGVDADARGGVWVCTREGDVWTLADAKWRKFAEGLQEPCGLLLDRKDGKETGAVFVTQKPELTKLSDTDGDGVADDYARVCATGRTTGNYHEFNHGLVRDARGNFYGALNLSHANYGFATAQHVRVHGAGMGAAPGCSRGTFYKVTPEGKFEVLAWGLRSPCGVGIMPDGKLLFSDNQGDYMPTSFLTVVQRGAFYGHPAGIMDHPDYKGKDLNAISDAQWAKLRTAPAVWIPYRELASSPGQPVVDTTGGKFGPFAGQIFMGDQTQSNVMRFTLQEVKGQWQGFCIDFINHVRCGIVRGAFDKDGALWLGETGRGWGSSGDLPFGLEKVVWDGKTVPFCIKDIKHEKGGFRVYFTQPIASGLTAAQVGVKHWTYHFWATYGSPNVDEKKPAATGLEVAKDGLSLFFKTELVKTHVYDIKLPDVRSADGKALTTNHGYYTLNETLD